MPTPTVTQLKHAITIAEQIEKLQAELAGIVGGISSKVSSVVSAEPVKDKRGGKRKMSPETIAKMRAAQQARWAKKKGTTTSVVSPLDTPSEPKKVKAAKPEKKKRKLSPEGRARIVAALKARHAAKKK